MPDITPAALALLTKFHQAFMDGCFEEAASMVKDLLTHRVVLKIDSQASFRLDFAEWTPGNASYRDGRSVHVTYSAWTMPSPTRKVGNHWTGGNVSSLGDCRPFCGTKRFDGLALGDIVAAFGSVPKDRVAL